jgi:hypothetical protein
MNTEEVVEFLGKPIEEPSMIQGSLRNGNYAKYKIRFTGSKNWAELSILAYKSKGSSSWKYDKYELSNGKKVFNLKAEMNQKKVGVARSTSL